jgi:hypothetical protein
MTLTHLIFTYVYSILGTQWKALLHLNPFSSILSEDLETDMLHHTTGRRFKINSNAFCLWAEEFMWGLCIQSHYLIVLTHMYLVLPYLFKILINIIFQLWLDFKVISSVQGNDYHNSHNCLFHSWKVHVQTVMDGCPCTDLVIATLSYRVQMFSWQTGLIR